MITGAQAVVDCLRREGIDHVFGIPGTMNLPILDVLRATPEIRFVLTRHEQGAAFMAYGFARAVHRPAIVTATEGPGVTNLATGIGAAYKGYVPVISISGAQEIWVREKDASQDIDQVTMNRPITKWAYSIPSVIKVQEAVRRAFRVALSEPLGPVHLDVSRDILLEQVEAEPIDPAAYRPTSLPSCSAADLGVVFPVAQAVVGSTLSFVEGLRERLRKKWEWTSVAKLRREWEEERKRLLDYAKRPVLPPVVAHAMREALPADGIMIVDAGNAGKHMRVFMDTHQPDTFMYISDWGSVGAGLPMAMGAKLARPDRPVMACVGDMGMMCNLGELETAVREKIPVVCVVFNDCGLGNERAFQKELYGGRIFGVDYSDVDFAALARVFGAYGERVTDASALLPALKRALDSGLPAVVDVVIDQNTLAPVVYRK